MYQRFASEDCRICRVGLQQQRCNVLLRAAVLSCTAMADDKPISYLLHEMMLAEYGWQGHNAGKSLASCTSLTGNLESIPARKIVCAGHQQGAGRCQDFSSIVSVNPVQPDTRIENIDTTLIMHAQLQIKVCDSYAMVHAYTSSLTPVKVSSPSLSPPAWRNVPLGLCLL